MIRLAFDGSARSPNFDMTDFQSESESERGEFTLELILNDSYNIMSFGGSILIGCGVIFIDYGNINEWFKEKSKNNEKVMAILDQRLSLIENILI